MIFLLKTIYIREKRHLCCGVFLIKDEPHQLFLYNVLIRLPLAAQVENSSDEERRVSRDGISQPEAQITHVEGYSQEKCKADPDHYGIQNGYCKVYYVVSGAVGKGIGRRPEGSRTASGKPAGKG